MLSVTGLSWGPPSQPPDCSHGEARASGPTCLRRNPQHFEHHVLFHGALLSSNHDKTLKHACMALACAFVPLKL